MKRLALAALWLAAAAPALYQLFLLATAIAGRVAYPYDLEWMEGGMLHHAARIASGEGIYVPPSIDFIPYLYTPLYPSILALLGGAFGLGYPLGRAISVLSLVGVAIVAAVSLVGPGLRVRHPAGQPPLTGTTGAAWTGSALALGLFAAIYPYVEGWYDLVRADTLALFLVTAGVHASARWSTTGVGASGHGRVAAAAAILALAFFCKQTAIFYVGLGGAIVLFRSWRRAPTFVAVAGALGLGGTWLLDRASDGWFWIYVSKIHRTHDFNMDRFWKSFGNILWKFPAMTILVGVALVVVAVTALIRRALPPSARPLMLWSLVFAVSTVVGAIGWGTEFAHFNAYMPAFLHGGLAAGAAVPAVVGCVHTLWPARRYTAVLAVLAGLVAAAPLGVTLVRARWQPAQFIPTAADVAAGDKLIARLRAVEGEVWMPSHPWYLHLAGKPARVHRMGIKDVTTRSDRQVLGLDEALRGHRFAAIVLDDRDLNLELPALTASYRPALRLPADERPRVYTGAHVVPDMIWVPAFTGPPPAGARVVFDFEAPTWDGWTRSGAAWGNGPVAESQPGQALVTGAGGRRFATSMTSGDAGVGRVTSPPFLLDGPRVTLELAGGFDDKLRVELWVDGTIARTAGAPPPGGDDLHTISWDVAPLRGKPATLVLVDDSPTGHLDVDDVWVHATP